MPEPEFDAAEVIGGFPLVAIKGALAHVGLLEDQDAAESVAKWLRCGRQQAQRVLVALERRGFLTKSAQKQWSWTDLGRRLAFHWHPPRRVEPAIYREDDEAVSEIFDAVPCSILRAVGGDDALEEADLEAGVFVDLESDRVVQIEVSLPDDYDRRGESGSVIDTTVLLSVEHARRFVASLQSAIAAGEAELARRATAKPRKKKRAREPSSPPPATSVQVDREASQAAPQLPPTSKPRASSEASKPTPDRRSKAAEKAAALSKRKLAATLKELGGAASRTRRR